MVPRGGNYKRGGWGTNSGGNFYENPGRQSRGESLNGEGGETFGERFFKRGGRQIKTKGGSRKDIPKGHPIWGEGDRGEKLTLRDAT